LPESAPVTAVLKVFDARPKYVLRKLAFSMMPPTSAYVQPSSCSTLESCWRWCQPNRWRAPCRSSRQFCVSFIIASYFHACGAASGPWLGWVSGFRSVAVVVLCVTACGKCVDPAFSVCRSHSERREFIRVTLNLPTVPFEQRFCSKQDTCDILLAICDRMPELAYIPDVLMHKIKQ
jgi:hypothetical protein